MPAQACLNCEHIRTAFAERIAKGEKFRCTDCGTMIPTANTNQYWLLTGSVPIGPFSIAQIHSKLSAGEITQQTSACIVGGSNWLPLIQTPGIGPPVVPKAGESTAGSSSPVPGSTLANPSTGTKSDQLELQPPPLPGREPAPNQGRGGEEPPPLTRRSDGGTRGGTIRQAGSSEEIPPPLPPMPSSATTNPSGSAVPNQQTSPGKAGYLPDWVLTLLFAAGVVCVAYLAYREIRPLTAIEVCKKWEAAKTLADAKKYVTPRFYQLLEALESAKSPSDPNDTFDWTQEIDGPQPNTKLVGFHGSWFDQEAGKRVRVEGHLRVMGTADGWKIDDMVFTGIEGLSLPGPMSLVDEFKRSGGLPKSATPNTPTSKSTSTSTPKSPPASTSNPHPLVAIVKWGYETFGVIGGVVALIALAAIYGSQHGFIRKRG